jgi:hypothetical protein
MAPNISRLKKPALWFFGVFSLLVVLAWLALPGIVQSQAEEFVAAKSGHRLSLARPEINPFALSLRLRDLRLDDPGGAPLAAFKELFVDLSLTSVASRTLVFDAITLDGLKLSLVQRQAGLNWNDLIAALASKDAPPTEPQHLPRLDIQHFALTGGVVEIADQRTTPAFSTQIEPLTIELSDVSTLPNDKGQFSIAARTSFGAALEWSGDISLSPIASSGTLRLSAVDLGRLAPLLQGKLPVLPPSGVAAAETSYRVAIVDGKLDLVLDKLGLQVSNLAIRKDDGETTASWMVDSIALKDGHVKLENQRLTLPTLSLQGIRLEAGNDQPPHDALVSLDNIQIAQTELDLAQRQASVAGITLDGGKIAMRRNAAGRIDLLDAISSFSDTAATAPDAASKPPAPAWRYRVERIGLTGYNASLRDESAAPALELAVGDIGIELTGLNENLQEPLPLAVSLNVDTGGHLDIKGKVVPAEAAVDLQLKLADLALKPAQPFLTRAAALQLRSGKINAEGRVVHNAKQSTYRGSFAVRDLNLTQEDEKETFLGWKSLATRQLDVSPTRLDIGELRLDGLDAKLIIYTDKSINLKRIQRAPADTPEPGAGAAVATKPPFAVNLDRLRFSAGKLDFGDYSLLVPFETRIHGLRGSINGLSTTPGAPGQLELDGEVDNFGLARAVGQIDTLNPTGYTDLKVIFRNLEMNRLTPYAVTFAGRKIDSGRMSLDLEYKIKDRQLQGENQIVVESLVLGERVENPTAKDLPLDLAIALLQDSDGRIDLGLPIAGSLDDPQFSYGQIIWKAFTNVLGKIVTTPFRALGALFGSGGEKLDSIAFDPGSARLAPPEREKLNRIATVLNKRPGLALTVQGTWAEIDRPSLQDRQTRRAAITKTGETVSARGDPGPISTRAPKMQAALEALFAERFGADELTALKDGFRRANPGQMEESMTGKMMSRLSGLMREKRSLPEADVDLLKGADFHGVLFERLREKEVVSDDELQALATRRNEHVLELLKAAGAPEGRYRAGAAEKTETTGRDVPLKLDIGKAG